MDKISINQIALALGETSKYQDIESDYSDINKHQIPLVPYLTMLELLIEGAELTWALFKRGLALEPAGYINLKNTPNSHSNQADEYHQSIYDLLIKFRDKVKDKHQVDFHIAAIQHDKYVELVTRVIIKFDKELK